MEREEFIEKCKKELKEIRKETADMLINENLYTDFYIYKLEFCEELLELLSRRQGNIIIDMAISQYGKSEKILGEIFSKYITVRTEPKLISENKMFSFLEKFE